MVMSPDLTVEPRVLLEASLRHCRGPQVPLVDGTVHRLTVVLRLAR